MLHRYIKSAAIIDGTDQHKRVSVFVTFPELAALESQTGIWYTYGILQTKFLTGCGPMHGKSVGIGSILSSLADCKPTLSKPFLQRRANLIGEMLALLVVVHRRPPFFTSGAAKAISSSASFLMLHRFFFLPTLVLGGSTMTISYFSPRLASFSSHSKPMFEKRRSVLDGRR